MSKNLATTTIASHPGPPTSATSVTVATGTGSRLYAGMAVIHPAGATPTPSNAEVISITDVTGDVLTIVRAQESSTARAIVTGDVITQGITAAMWDSLVASNAGKAPASHVHSAADVTSGTLPLARGGTGGTDAATARTSLGLGTAAVESPATLAASTAFTATFGLRAPDWVAARAYIVGELVASGGTLYRCTTAHTSSGSIALGNFASLSGGGGGGSSLWVDVKTAYSLKGDTKQLVDVVTNGTGVITSASAPFVAGDVGKTIRVESATPVITTIASYQSATQVTLAANVAAGTGRIAYFGTDDTVAIQQALNDYGFVSALSGGKVTLYFSAGCYMIAGAVSADAWVTQLRIPFTDMSDDIGTVPWTLRILGDGRNEGYYLSGNPAPPMAGTIFYSPLQGTLNANHATFRTAPQGSTYPNANYVHIEVDGMTWRTGNKSHLTPLSLAEANTARVGWERGVTVDVGVPTNVLDPTSTSSIGISFPGLNNGAHVSVGTVYINGYHYGFTASEHFDAKCISVQSCWAAGRFDQMNHACHIDRVLVQHCKYGFGATSPTYLSIDQYDAEHVGSGVFTFVNDFDDTNNRFNCSIGQFHIVGAGVGADNSGFTVTGGLGIHAIPAGPKITTKTANYTMTNADVAVVSNGASLTITLPNAANAIKGGREYRVKNIHATPCTVASGGGTIDGATTDSLPQWATRAYISDGTNWLSASRDQAGAETVNTVATSGAAQTIPSPAIQSTSRITLTANCTLTFPTAITGQSFTLALVQDATGSRLVTWPASAKWPGGTAPTLSTGANKVDFLSFTCVDGSTWSGFVAGLDVR